MTALKELLDQMELIMQECLQKSGAVMEAETKAITNYSKLLSHVKIVNRRN